MKNITRLNDMLKAIAAIETYSPRSYDRFLKDQKVQDAIMFNLVVLGEAANKIETDFQERHPQIPWSSIIGTRNVIVHGYDQVRLSIVWEIIQNDIEGLKLAIESVVK
jgi:uncharacterized protein with HEPN domain